MHPAGRAAQRGKAWRGAALAVLAIMLAWKGIQLVLVILAGPRVDMPQQGSLPAEQAGRPVDIAALQNSRLFGTASLSATTQTPASTAGSVAAAQTRLDLRLDGVVVGQPAESGFAMIQSNGRPGSYRIGDRLPVGSRVVLDSIHADHVVLENNGALESLWLYGEDEPASRTNAGMPSAGSSGGLEVGPGYDPVALVKQYREQYSTMPATADFHTLSEILEISPAQQNGMLLGYRLTPGEHLKEFVQLGLQINDIVTGVNDIELNDIRNLPALYEVMTRADRVTLSLIREGRPLELELDLDGD